VEAFEWKLKTEGYIYCFIATIIKNSSTRNGGARHASCPCIAYNHFFKKEKNMKKKKKMI
jgi:hypothetical protein